MLQLRTLLASALLSAAPLQVAWAAQPFRGTNCDIIEPPAEAGDIFHAVGKTQVAGRVFPRLSDLGTSYTGCQVLWSVINGGPRYRSLIYLRNGQVQALYPEPDVPLCKKGEKTIETGCNPRQRALLVSYPPGCAARTVQSGTVPQDCVHEFNREFAIWDQLAE
jgi:hypothetical protein